MDNLQLATDKELKNDLVKKLLEKKSLRKLNQAQVWRYGSCYQGVTKGQLIEKLTKYYAIEERLELLTLIS